ncbi:MAG TPA: DsbA family oxidoreductase [Acidimicrobiales bacterium]|nr:DsbA family oxidoreductase [Acidimicrobiales bacterium]
MTDPLVLELWADVVCPFCNLGRHQLADALTRFAHADEVVLVPRAFELDPSMPAVPTHSNPEMLAAKYGITLEAVAAMHARLEAQAATHAMTWDLAATRPTNTFDAHRLVALAATQGRAEAMLDALYHAHFSDARLVSDRAVLDELAESACVAGSGSLWTSDAFAAEVRRDEARAHELGLRGVPALVLDSAFLVSGAQGADAFADALSRAWARREGL